MGLHVVALDVAAEKLALARSLGADVAVDARAPDAAAQVLKATGGGAPGVLVTAGSQVAFAQALGLQNGRASCRERACQEVYVSGVPVSLKKKTTKIN